MSGPQLDTTLLALAHAAHDLARMCEREASEYAHVWHGIAGNAEALRSKPSRDDLEDLLRSVAMLFSHHPASFSEVYVKRSSPDEQSAENAELDRLKAEVAKAAAEVRGAAREWHVSALLQELATAVREMTDILRVERSDHAPFWEQVATDAASLSSTGTPREAERLSRAVSRVFGAGMGSFGDISINDRFEVLRATVGSLLGRIEDAARTVTGVDRPTVRTLLVNLETVLLDARIPAAARVREVFRQDELDYARVRDILRALREERPRWPAPYGVAIEKLLDELRSLLEDA